MPEANKFSFTQADRELLRKAVEGTGYDLDGLLTYASVGMTSVSQEMLFRSMERKDTHGQENALQLAKHGQYIGALGLHNRPLEALHRAAHGVTKS